MGSRKAVRQLLKVPRVRSVGEGKQKGGVWLVTVSTGPFRHTARDRAAADVLHDCSHIVGRRRK